MQAWGQINCRQIDEVGCEALCKQIHLYSSDHRAPIIQLQVLLGGIVREVGEFLLLL